MRTRMVQVIGLSLTLVVLQTGCTRRPRGQKDQVSYTIGVQFGRSLKDQHLDLNPSAIAKGIEDGLKNEKILLSDEEMQSAVMRLSQDQRKQQVDEASANKSKAEGFLTKNKSEPGVQTTASGLQYKILEGGAGPAPKPDDVVVVHYKGTLVDGTEFDSSYKRNTPAEFPINGVIPGWAEGLQLLRKGGKGIFYVPPELGYGDRPRQQIPGNAVLIFDVHLIDVKPGSVQKSAPKVQKEKGKK